MYRLVWMELPSGRLCATRADAYFDSNGRPVAIEIPSGSPEGWAGRTGYRFVGSSLPLAGTCEGWCRWYRKPLK